MTWRKSSYCSAADACVEVAHTSDRTQLRDSKDPDGPILTFARPAWAAFVAGVKAGEFDA